MRDPFIACVPANFDPGHKDLSISHLVSIPLILLNAATATRGTIDRIAKAHGIELHPQYEVQNAITAIAIAAAGLGVAVVPEGALLQTGLGQFRVVPISDEGAHRDVGIITRRGLALHPHAEQLIKLIRANFRKLA